MSTLEDQITDYLKKRWEGHDSLSISDLRELLGGYSKTTYSFDLNIHSNGEKSSLPLIFRRDTPKVSAILPNSRELEHKLLNRLREHTSVPVPKSYFAEMDRSIFGEASMFIERVLGCTEPTSLVKSPETAAEAESVARDLCEKVAALHLADASLLNHDHLLDDPRQLGMVPDTWDHYMDGMLNFFINNYRNIDFDTLPVLYDAFLHMRRNRPRPLPLRVVHGELNPANIVFKDGKILSIVDWENAHLGDPREDLGWFCFMDAASGTNFFNRVNYPGGFLGYYNHLTGFNVTLEELYYFQIFGFASVSATPIAAIKRRIAGEHSELLHLYLLQLVFAGCMGFTQLLGYPQPQAAK